jgi:hypothetical protein
MSSGKCEVLFVLAVLAGLCAIYRLPATVAGCGLLDFDTITIVVA